MKRPDALLVLRGPRPVTTLSILGRSHAAKRPPIGRPIELL